MRVWGLCAAASVIATSTHPAGVMVDGNERQYMWECLLIISIILGSRGLALLGWPYWAGTGSPEAGAAAEGG